MTFGLTIGQLAKSVGVNVQTVRYYERRRLLIPSDRKPSGYRLYGDEAIRRLRFIKNAQALGFTLREIAELLNLRITSAARCGDVQRRAQAKLGQVEAKVRDLRALVQALRRLIKDCRAGQPTDRCPILKALEDEKEGKGEQRQRKEVKWSKKRL
jgi:MerR family mercuric resistance operon transcriptional regulator/MerR family gold-responsive transcriptional activator of gol and ges genes